MGEEKKPKSAGVWPTVKPFVNGGASGMLATCVIQPIDMIKVFYMFLSKSLISLHSLVFIILHSFPFFHLYSVQVGFLDLCFSCSFLLFPRDFSFLVHSCNLAEWNSCRCF